MNAVPHLKPITIRPIQRPAFNNAMLGFPQAWIAQNEAILSLYFQTLTEALPPDERSGREDDYRYWQLVQHDVETQRNRPDNDPTPWCAACGAMVKARCHCGAIADNE